MKISYGKEKKKLGGGGDLVKYLKLFNLELLNW